MRDAPPPLCYSLAERMPRELLERHLKNKQVSYDPHAKKGKTASLCARLGDDICVAPMRILRETIIHRKGEYAEPLAYLPMKGKCIYGEGCPERCHKILETIKDFSTALVCEDLEFLCSRMRLISNRVLTEEAGKTPLRVAFNYSRAGGKFLADTEENDEDDAGYSFISDGDDWEEFDD